MEIIFVYTIKQSNRNTTINDKDNSGGKIGKLLRAYSRNLQLNVKVNKQANSNTNKLKNVKKKHNVEFHNFALSYRSTLFKKKVF